MTRFISFNSLGPLFPYQTPFPISFSHQACSFFQTASPLPVCVAEPPIRCVHCQVHYPLSPIRWWFGVSSSLFSILVFCHPLPSGVYEQEKVLIEIKSGCYLCPFFFPPFFIRFPLSLPLPCFQQVWFIETFDFKKLRPRVEPIFPNFSPPSHVLSTPPCFGLPTPPPLVSICLKHSQITRSAC